MNTSNFGLHTLCRDSLKNRDYYAQHRMIRMYYHKLWCGRPKNRIIKNIIYMDLYSFLYNILLIALSYKNQYFLNCFNKNYYHSVFVNFSILRSQENLYETLGTTDTSTFIVVSLCKVIASKSMRMMWSTGLNITLHTLFRVVNRNRNEFGPL